MQGQQYTVPFTYLSKDLKSRINAKLWTNEEYGSPDWPGSLKPKGVIQIVHGMAEHIDRYDGLARYMVDRGFVVCAEDHIGHGETASSPDEYGHMPAYGGKDILLGDVHTLRLQVADCFPDVPYVLYGHSMGSFIAPRRRPGRMRVERHRQRSSKALARRAHARPCHCLGQGGALSQQAH